MIKTYFMDGDKGGVGKSFAARAIADMLMQSERFRLPRPISRLLVVDADESNQDVCGYGGFAPEAVNDCQVDIMMQGIVTPEQWTFVGNEVSKKIDKWAEEEENRIVFSLPAGAGLAIAQASEVTEIMGALNAAHVWVIGTDHESVRQLQERLDRFPKFYERGFVILNMRHGTRDKFSFWDQSATRTQAIDSGWREIELPVLTPFVASELSRTPLHQAESNRAINGGGKLGLGSFIAVKTFRGIAGARLAEMEMDAAGKGKVVEQAAPHDDSPVQRCAVASASTLATHLFMLCPARAAALSAAACTPGSTRSISLPDAGFSGGCPSFAQASM